MCVGWGWGEKGGRGGEGYSKCIFFYKDSKSKRMFLFFFLGGGGVSDFFLLWIRI